MIQQTNTKTKTKPKKTVITQSQPPHVDRFWSINRAYTPGISRLGAVIWTGDIPVSWDSLANQPGYILNWHMAGAGFITCDTGALVLGLDC